MWAGRSANRTQTSIPEYKETAGRRINLPSGQEAGDPAKLAETVITVAESEKPPLRLLLGREAYEIARQKFTNLLDEIEDWKEITIETDFKE